MYEILVIGMITLCAAGVGTATGFGTSTIMIPVLSLWLGLPVALLFVGIIHLFGDVWKVVLFKKGLDWKLLLLFGGSGVAASYFGASLSFQDSGIELKRILGCFLVLYVVFLLSKRKWVLPKTSITAVSGGLLSGVCAGFFGVGGAVRGAFLTAFDLEKEVYIFTSGAIALFIDITRVGRYFGGGTKLEEGLLWALLLCVPVSFCGAYLAKRLLNRIPQRAFRIFVVVFLALVGAKLILWP
jgi:uncharacterized membrane protein YfcA